MLTGIISGSVPSSPTIAGVRSLVIVPMGSPERDTDLYGICKFGTIPSTNCSVDR